MKFVLNTEPASGLTLSQLEKGLKDEMVGKSNDDKSLRLHTHTGSFIKKLNVHTKIDGLFGKGRAERRSAAVNLVNETLKNEYKISDATAKNLMTSVMKKSDRITFGELKQLSALAQEKSRVLAADAQVTKAMDVFSLSRADAEGLVKMMMPVGTGPLSQADLQAIDQKITGLLNVNQAQLNSALGEAINVALGRQPQLSAEAETFFRDLINQGISPAMLTKSRTAVGADALPGIKALYRELNQTEGVAELEKLVHQLQSAKSGDQKSSADPALQNFISSLLPMNGKAVVVATEAAKEKLVNAKKAAFQGEGSKQVGALKTKWASARAQTDQIPAHALTGDQVKAFQSSGLNAQLALDVSHWKVASLGAGGALLINDPANPKESAVLKIENSGQVAQTTLISKFIAAVSDLFGGPTKAPFESSTTVEVALSDTQKEELKQKLTDLRAISSPTDQAKIDKHLATLNSPDAQVSFSKLTMVEGKDLNKLPPQEKLALLHLPQFAHDIGQLFGLSTFMGLDDHFAIADVHGAFSPGQTNLSNVMVSSTTSKPVLIDLGSMFHLSDGDIKKAYSSLTDFLKTIDSPEKFDEVLEGLIDRGVNPDAPVLTPLDDVMKAFLRPDPGNNHLMPESEKFLADNDVWSKAEKKQFAANLVLGVTQALQFIASHAEGLTAKATSEGSPFQNSGDVIGTIASQIGDLSPTQAVMQSYLAK